MPADPSVTAFRLSLFTVGYNLLEGLAALAAGAWTGSIALVGFGADSFMESLSGGIMIWRFAPRRGGTPETEERAERTAVHIVGWTFVLLAAYVLYESIEKLTVGRPPAPSLVGILIAVASLLVMPVLYILKRRTAARLGSSSLLADSKQTLACMILSAALLLGVGLNYLLGFWQADPIVGLGTAAYLAREGWETLREKHLCAC
jgi:cation diffusion facilitator family transporter